MFCKSSLEQKNIYFFLFFCFVLSLFIGMIDLFFSSSLSCSNVICTENNKKCLLMCFPQKTMIVFFCFFANDTNIDDIQKNLVCLINYYLCLFICFSSKFICIILYIISFMLIFSHIDKSFLFFLESSFVSIFIMNIQLNGYGD